LSRVTRFLDAVVADECPNIAYPKATSFTIWSVSATAGRSGVIAYASTTIYSDFETQRNPRKKITKIR
jgi:hypothetical protein